MELLCLYWPRYFVSYIHVVLVLLCNDIEREKKRIKELKNRKNVEYRLVMCA